MVLLIRRPHFADHACKRQMVVLTATPIPRSTHGFAFLLPAEKCCKLVNRIHTCVFVRALYLLIEYTNGENKQHEHMDTCIPLLVKFTDAVACASAELLDVLVKNI